LKGKIVLEEVAMVVVESVRKVLVEIYLFFAEECTMFSVNDGLL
jgi:hypothetical protein